MTTILNSDTTNGSKNEDSLYTYITVPCETSSMDAGEVQLCTLPQNIVLKTLPDGRMCLIDSAVNAFLNSQNMLDVGTPKPDTEVAHPPKQRVINGEMCFANNKSRRQNFSVTDTLKCNTCGEIFEKMFLYRKHMRAHRNMKKYRCDQCLESYNVEDNFKLHKAMHVKGKPMCPLCDRKFQRLASLKAHLLLHQVEETFTCKDCYSEFDKEDDYNKHIAKHLDDNSPVQVVVAPYICTYCNYSFKNLPEYKEHISFHIKIKKLVYNGKKYKRKINTNKDYPHKCEICKKSFLKVCLLERHLRTHSGEKPFVCSFCNRGFAQKGTLQIHLTKHTGIKPFKCSLCPAKFCQKGNLRVHVERTHTAPGPGEKLYTCTQCTCIFKKVASLNAHITRTHSIVKKSICVVSDGADKWKHKKNFDTDLPVGDGLFFQDTANLLPLGDKCSLTTIHSSINGSIRKYIVRQRKNCGIRWYICSFCTKEFKKPSDLIRHIRTHTKEKPYKCKYCAMTFTLKSTLSTHANTHFGSRDYRCLVCSKVFTSIRTLNIHLRKHDTNAAAKQTHYKCSACNKIFNSITKATNHMSLHTISTEGGAPQKTLQMLNDLKPLVMKQPLLETVNGFLPVAAPKPKVPYSEMEQYKTRPFKCHICTAAFTKPVHLKRHMLTHTGEKKFKCDVCSKPFYTTYALKEHMNFHNGVRNYACDFCSKKFVTSTILKRHLTLHTTQRPYVCPYCKKRFKTVILCRKHINIHKRDINMQFHALSETGELTNLEENETAKILNFSDTFADNLFNVPEIPLEVTITDNSTDKKATKANAVEVNKPKKRNNRARKKKIPAKSSLKENESNLKSILDGENILNTFAELNKDQSTDLCNNISQQISANPPDSIGVIDGNQSLFSTIYVNSDNMQILNNNTQYNALMPQNKLENNDPLLMSTLNELQDSNIFFPLDPTLSQASEYSADSQNFDTFNSNLIFNTINELNLSPEKPHGHMLPSMDEITQKQSRSFNIQNNQKSDGQKTLLMADGLSLSENVLILSNEVLKPSSLNYFPDIQFTLDSQPPDLNSLNLPLEEDIQDENEDVSIYEPADFICTLCKLVCKSLIHLQKHECMNINLAANVESIILQDNIFEDASLNIQNDDRKHNPDLLANENDTNPPQELEQQISEDAAEIDSSLTCSLCNKSFSFNLDLYQHMTEHKYKRQSDNSCTYCEKVFKKPSDLKRHIRTHTGEKPFKCEKCDKSFSLKSTRDSHHRTHNLGTCREFKCPVCNLNYSSNASLKNHLLRHTGVKPYQCHLCPSKFRTSRLRKTHVANHFKNSASTLDNEKEVEEMLDTVLTTTDALSLEEQIEVEQDKSEVDDVQITLQDTGESVNLGEIIQISPYLLQQLQSGVLLLNDTPAENVLPQTLLHFNIENTGPEPIVTLDGLDVSKTNADTGQYSEVINELQNIIITTETIDTSKPFPCEICHKRYQTKAILRKHLKTHGVGLPFSCTKCKKGFETEDVLDRHLKLHLGYRPFSCQLCTNSFGEEGSLKIHMKRIHRS